MHYEDIGGTQVSRFGLGTKRFPTQDASRVIHLDTDAAAQIVDACVDQGVNFFDTSYSNHKGEAETFLGEYLPKKNKDLHVCTNFFEMVDPRYEYVFQKQLKKLASECIDFYSLEGVTDLNKEVNVKSGAVDYLFKQKENGKIGKLGFSSELNASNLRDFMKRYPWDFVRLRINYFDWFIKGVRDQYEAICDAGLPIIAHGALRTGPKTHLKKEAAALLKEANPDKSTVDWALRFVKSLNGVSTVTCNVYSVAQVQEDIDVFQDDEILDANDFLLLEEVAHAQKTKINSASPQ